MDDNVTVVYMDYDMVKDHIPSPNYQSGNAQFQNAFKLKDDGPSKRLCRSFAKAVEPSIEDILDPFDDDTTFQCTSNEHKSVLERFPAVAIFDHQPRTHLFTAIVGGQCVHIIPWDRSGSLVTQKFDYVHHPWMLGRFPGHFMHTSATQRGHDTTATRILASSDDHKHMRKRAYVPQTNAPRRLVRALRALLTDPERLTLKCLDQRDVEPRRSDRPGTWEFMSATSLGDPQHAIVVEDDMESFFHLLLFCAIRYLTHNFQESVPTFVLEYFEAYFMRRGEYFCGAAKLAAMTCGRIFFPNVVGSLTFYLPGEPRSSLEASSDLGATPVSTSTQHTSSTSAESSSPGLHPINAVFSRLLRWIQARYALANEPKSLSADITGSEFSAPLVDEANAEPTEEERWFMEEYGMDDEEEEDDEEALDVDELSPEQRGAFKKLAAKLKEHKDVLSLFRIALCRSKNVGAWPRRDKVPDQLRLDSQFGG